MHEKHIRSILKAISWRVLATTTTILAAYFFIGDISVALSIGAVEATAKMFLYYMHERSWNKVVWGRVKIIP